jgi:glycolate oxidase iron-sulfur subunit
VAVCGVTFDDQLLSQCVGCGMCLPVCPTFVVSRLEQHGPRGRIMGMRLVHAGELLSDDPGYVDSIETCVQCRACEAMCPSGVAFGALMEQAHADLAGRRPSTG